MSDPAVVFQNVEASTIRITGVTVGLTGAEVQELTKAAAAGAVGPLTDKIIDLTAKLGVTHGAALAMLRALGHEVVPIERLPDMLAAAATQVLAMRLALSRATNDGNEIAELRGQAVAALDAGDFNEATRLLNVVRELEREASERRQRQAEEGVADWLAGLVAEAELCTLLGRAALAQRDLAGAMARFEEGLDLLSPVGQDASWSYSSDAAEVLLNFGDLAGRNDAIEAAIQLYRLALANVPQEERPIRWSQTQNNLGRALLILGQRVTGVTRITEAAAAFRQSLEILTPLLATSDQLVNWATISNNLAGVLARLGERMGDSQKLSEALSILETARARISRDHSPLTWAIISNSLASTLRFMAVQEVGSIDLRRATSIYYEVIAEFDKLELPAEWAVAQNNLSTVLLMIGRRQKSRTILIKAETALRAALTVRTRERVPLLWATSQNNLGNVLQSLGKLEHGRSRLLAAVAAYNAALEERTRTRVPLEWAETKNNLGFALRILGLRTPGTELLEQSIDAFHEALEERTRVVAPAAWEETQNNLAKAVRTLELREQQIARRDMSRTQTRKNRPNRRGRETTSP
jgi:tetratricopeptide (TPR) repeat protein